MPSVPGATMLIGIGTRHRGDDAAGPEVARLARRMLPGAVVVEERDADVAWLLAGMEGAAAIYLVDACVAGGAPGTVYRFDAAAGPLPADVFGLSTHGFGLAAAIELARALGA